jgi:hypothetical protein
MKTTLFGWLCLIGSLITTGCGRSGDSETVPVAGTIIVDGRPAGYASIQFLPVEHTLGNGGGAITDANGRYSIVTPKKTNGLAPGKYKITISRRLNKDGSPADPKIPPADSAAAESLPKKFSDRDQTTLFITLMPDDKSSVDFKLKTSN